MENIDCNNRMEKVCDLLHIQFMKSFEIYGEKGLFRISHRGIEKYIEKDWHTAQASLLEDLLTGSKTIKQCKFKPTEGDKYFIITDKDLPYSSDYKLITVEFPWNGTVADLERFRMGNCFKSRKDAELSKEKYVDDLRKYYEEFVTE